LRPGTVVVLDEASMAATRDLAELVRYIEQAGGRLVLCGDDRQLPSVRAGGLFRALAARTDPIQLHDNLRQAEPWEREALDALRDGVVSDAIRLYEANDRLVLGGDRRLLVDRLVADWWAARSRGDAVMIALRRADVRELNARARSLMRSVDALGPDVRIGSTAFATGDRVVLRLNDRGLGVNNGDLGIVQALDSTWGRWVQTRTAEVFLPRWYLEASPRRPSVQHAYAITGHVAQGMTVDRALVLGSPDMYREWGCTVMSRGRVGNRLYVLARTISIDESSRRRPATCPVQNSPFGRACRRDAVSSRRSTWRWPRSSSAGRPRR
jgi:ATP-dependent exoDNAse (exonuclease V) alpha subunit